jgi:acid phosphatase
MRVLSRSSWLVAACLALAACSSGAAPPSDGAAPTGPPASMPGPTAPGAPSLLAPSRNPGLMPTTRPAGPGAGAAGVPRFDHVVVAVFENHGYARIVGSQDAPYLNRLAARGVLLTDSHGVTHPSQPNYLALFSGGTHGIPDDSCPHDLPGVANLGSQLETVGRSFTGYAEGLPSVGYPGCTAGQSSYARKHAPWVNFPAVPAQRSRPWSDFPTDFAALPSVALVVPDLCHDMHDCAVSVGDTWAAAHLDPYARWAATHNSLLIVTFDEDEGTGTATGRIPTILAGDHVRPGRYGGPVDHYRVLRTVEAAFGLPGLGLAGSRTPIAEIWR